MASLAKKVGYLRGLLEGAQLSKEDPTGKLLHGIVDLLSDLSDHSDEVDEFLEDLNEYVESIDDDLSELEGNGVDEDDDEDEYDFLHNLDDEDEDDFEDDPFGGEDQLHLLSKKDADDAEDAALEGGICPACGGISFISEEDDPTSQYVCPHCGKKVRLAPLSEDNTPIAKPVKED